MTRSFAHTKQLKMAKINKVLEAKAKRSKTTNGSALDFAYWSSANTANICKHRTEPFTADRNIPPTGDHFSLFENDIASTALHEFMDFVPVSAAVSHNTIEVEEKISYCLGSMAL